MGVLFVLAGFSTISNAMALFSPILYGLWLYSIQLSTRLIMDAKVEVELQAQHEGKETGHKDDCSQKKGPAHMRREFYGDRNGRGLLMRIRKGLVAVARIPLTFIGS